MDDHRLRSKFQGIAQRVGKYIFHSEVLHKFDVCYLRNVYYFLVARTKSAKLLDIVKTLFSLQVWCTSPEGQMQELKHQDNFPVYGVRTTPG